MSGSLVTQNADVQLGNDANGMLLRPAVPTLAHPLRGTAANGWVYNNFNPLIAPNQSTQEVPLLFRGGVIAGYDTNISRNLEFDVYFPTQTRTAMRNSLVALTKATRITDAYIDNEISWNSQGVKFVIFGRFRGVDVDPVMAGRNVIHAKIRFLMTDPAIYDIANTITINLPPVTAAKSTTSSGLPSNSDSAILAQAQTVVLAGDMPTRWAFTITSPWTNPTVYDIGNQQVMAFTQNGRNLYSTVTTDIITANMPTHQVLYTLGGSFVGSANGLLGPPSSWFHLDPINSPYQFVYLPNFRLGTTTGTMSSYTGASCSLTYMRAYLYHY